MCKIHECLQQFPLSLVQFHCDSLCRFVDGIAHCGSLFNNASGKCGEATSGVFVSMYLPRHHSNLGFILCCLHPLASLLDRNAGLSAGAGAGVAPGNTVLLVQSAEVEGSPASTDQLPVSMR